MNTNMAYNIIIGLIKKKSKTKEDLFDMVETYLKGKMLSETQCIELKDKIIKAYEE